MKRWTPCVALLVLGASGCTTVRNECLHPEGGHAARDAGADGIAVVPDGRADARPRADSAFPPWVDETPAIEPGSPFDVWGSGPSDVYVVGTAGMILHSNGTGAWTRQKSGTSVVLRGVWGSSAGDVWVVGDSGTILHSTGDGTWTAKTDFTTAGTLRAVWGASDGNVYIAGDGGGIYNYYPDLGSLLARSDPSGTTSDLLDVWGSGPGDVYMVGAGGALLHGACSGCTPAEGVVWTAETSPFASGVSIVSVWGSSSTSVFLADGTSQIAARTAGGWTTASVGTSVGVISDGWTDGTDSFLVGGPLARVLHSTSGGPWMNEIPGGLCSAGLAAVWGASASTVYAVGGGGIWHRE